MNGSRPLTTGDIARYCHVTSQAVLNWIKAGKLQAYSTPGGQHRIEPHIFLEFLDQYDMPVPSDLRPTGTAGRYVHNYRRSIR